MEQRQTEAYKRSFSDSVGAGIGALTGSGKRYYILEHRTASKYHHAGESQKIILNQIELGRDPQCQIRFDDSFSTVSRRHAAIVRDGDRWRLIHLSKVNQTFVNGQEIHDQWYLENGDEIQLSSNGPRLGFILPQGDRSMIKNINFTERFSLFRQQVMKPYQRMMWIFVILFILVVGGLIGWNYYSDLQAKARNEVLTAQIAQDAQKHQEAIGDLEQKMEDANARREEAQRALAEVTSQQIRQVGNAVASSNANNRNAITESQRRSEQLMREERERAEKELADAEKRALEAEAALQKAKEEVTPTISGTAPAPRPTSYSAYFPYIYYIQLDKIETVDARGRRSTFNTLRTRWAGTGFLLADGRFVTSRKILERWFYRFGDRDTDRDFNTLNKIVEDKGSVIAYFTAFSSTGDALTFTSQQFTYDRTGDVYDSKLKLHVAPGSTDKDWAYFNTAKGGGLKYNPAKSNAIERGVELTILGFPGEVGINSASGPVFGSGVTANSGLQLGLIQTTNTSFELGGSGAPVLLPNAEGVLEVVGLVSTVANGQRGIVIPISIIR